MPEKISLHEDCVLIFDSHDFAVFFDVREHGDPSIDAAVLIAGQVPVTGLAVDLHHGDGKRALETKRGDDHLAPNAAQLALGEIAAVPRRQPVHHLGFAGGANLDGFAFLDRTDLLDDLGAPDQQILNLLVDGVDFLADFRQRFLFIGHDPNARQTSEVN